VYKRKKQMLTCYNAISDALCDQRRDGRRTPLPPATGDPSPMTKLQPISGILILTSFICHYSMGGEVAKAPSPAVAGPAVPLAGHSSHGDAFNEGPRQNAYRMGGTGNVRFSVTTDNQEAQQFFNQGMGQLHGFWFYEAERSFRRARSLDPSCAMASWGMAMANLDNPERGREFIGEAINKVELQESVSDRERDLVVALAKYLKEDDRDDKRHRQDYIKALESIACQNPDDIEVKALLAVHVWRNSGHDLPINSHVAVDALISQILSVEPSHPVHHYRIHLWDREQPSQALSSAACCGQAAPSIAHMWHMPGHIYSRLKRYADAAWQQEASARADHAYMMRDLVLPDQIHNYAHNNEWLIRNLIHLGRSRDALALAKNMLELPRHPKYNQFGREDKDSCQYGRARLIQVLETFELWSETIALAQTMYLELTDDLNEQAKRLRLLGIANHHTGDFAAFDACRQELDTLMGRVEQDAQAAADSVKTAEVAAADSADGDSADGDSADGDSADGDGADGDGADGDGADGDGADGDGADGDGADGDGGAADEKPENNDAEEIKAAAESAAEEVRGKHKEVANARRELRGLRELARGDTDAAATTFGACDDLTAARMARYAFRWGNHEMAKTRIADAVQTAENEVGPLAVQTDLLRRMGDAEGAKASLEALRTVASQADLDTPLLASMSLVAADNAWPSDWRLAQPLATDVGNRPDHASLGPFRWSPVSAPQWALPDAHGGQIQLADYAHRPVLVIFYLGYGCLHCAEQLQAFRPREADFSDTGIDLVAISTDSTEALARSIRNFSADGSFEIDLAADPAYEVFRAYRCFDDFEQTPLHGTFLIDEQGLIRWHDIGYEPFNDVEFLLGEAKRLLSIGPGGE